MTAPDQPDQPSSGDEWAGAPPGASIPASGQRPAPYGPDPYAAPVDFAAPPRQPIFDRADLWTVILGTIGVLLVGVIATFVWVWIAPRVMAVAGPNRPLPVKPETKAFAGADVTYLFVTLGAGLLCALIAAVVARHRGLAVTIAMAGGGILSSLMVAWGGRWLTGGPAGYWLAHHATGSTHQLFIQLQSRPFVVAWPFVALIVTFVVALATQDREPDTAAEASAAHDAVR